ncbi:MAG: GNAT family N-acetyltransferase [Bdellovibrionaceae bacterium]|nr:GNAT family N-acetyltransferase [Pseudobdellovibrionaceae bacterium]
MIQINPLSIFHVAELSELASDVFCKTFLPTNKAEPVYDYAKEYFNKEALEKTLLSPEYFTFGVFSEQKLIGYIQFVLNNKESYCGADLELKRFYLQHEYHGKGIAQDMMEFCFLKSKDLGHKKFWLGVWEKNDRAQSFYKKFGFRKVGGHLFDMGGEIQNDDIRLKELE